VKRCKILFYVPRNLVQLFFVLLSLYIGWQFYNFYVYLETAGLSGSPVRPPAVEAFIPLSALVGLRSWLGTGIFDYVHPAGLTVFLAILLVSFLFRKSFCSWICPFGYLQEILSRTGNIIFPRKIKIAGWPDILLRSLKYIFLAFFVGSVFFMMSPEAAASFLNLPYNKLVDLKMLMFFLNISATGIAVFGFLIIMSILVDQFWCRYLCPYGALLGLLGWLSPAKIIRRENACINCGACDKACPGHLKVSAAKNILSPECSGCLNCIEACPVPGALEYGFFGAFRSKKYLLPAAMLATFLAAILFAKAAGYWQSSVTLEEVFGLYQYINQF